MRDNSKIIEQLERRSADYKASIANMKAAMDADGVDRSGAMASEARCLASLEKQIADLSRKAETPAPAVTLETPAVKPKPTN